jgi:hypothetical protein
MKDKLKLIQLLRLAGIDLNDYKIHCAIDTSRNNRPLDDFFAGKFKNYQEIQTKKNFNKPLILSLIHLNGDDWLFAGIWKVLGIENKKYREGNKYYFKYKTKELSSLEHLTGRAIINFKKNFRASYLIGKKYEDVLFIKELREKRMSVGDFPGYNSVRLSYNLLKVIINQQNPSWKCALSSVAGVYLITDTKKGMQYVGSAYGGDGLWQRWAIYAKSGHGHNKDFKALLKAKGKDYALNFQFSILEICDLNASEEYVIGREVHWKEVLKTREFGLNNN